MTGVELTSTLSGQRIFKKEVLEKFDLIKGIMVRVKKPEAPVPGIYDYFGVEIKRAKDE